MTRMFEVAVLVLFVGVLLVGANAAYADAGVTHTVDNESISVDYASAQSVDEGGDQYASETTVRNSSGTTLQNGTDYEWHPSDGSVEWFNTSSTTDGETATISYEYEEKSQATGLSWGILRSFGGIVWILLFATMIFAVLTIASGSWAEGGGGL